jgi:hypothetical protein
VADEIVVSSAGDLLLTASLSAKIVLLLADRNGIPAHPAIAAGYSGSVNGTGSNVVKVSHIGLMGYDIQATGTEGSSVANTALTDGSTSITVVQKSKVYENSTLMAMLRGSLIAQDSFAMDAVVTSNATKLDMLANLVDNFSTVVGTSGSNATFANFLDCIAALEINQVQGPFFGCLHPRQWADIRADVAAASGGAIQWNAGSQAMIDRMKGLGSQGSFCGVDVWTTTRVGTANAGADRAGGIFGANAILWADGTAVTEGAADSMMLDGGRILFERVRTARAGLTAWVQHQWIGMAEGLDLAGVSLITDA